MSIHRARVIRRTGSLLALALAPGLAAVRPQGSLERTADPIWDISARTPLRVWVQPVSSAAAPPLLSVHAVRSAVFEWDALRLPVRLRLGPDSASANIHVVWTEKFDEPISGRTTCIDDGARHIVSAEVLLALRHTDGSVLSAEETRVLALHELGHAIGLAHAADSTSVMSPRVRIRSISAADSTRALRLYGRR